MSARSGPIYEVTLTVDREVIDVFDGWLAHHVEEMLAIPGFERARVFALEDESDGRARRVTHYYLESEDQLEQYFAGPADKMRQSGIDRFGDQLSATRRVLRETDIADGAINAVEMCLNCGSVLSGQYCGNCGQRSRSRLISLWELISDAFGDLLELDSRIWRTIFPLLLKPGKLTRDYLEGRRARFMPPFRTYLVLSILFFLVLLFDPKKEFGILFEPEPEVAAESSEPDQSAEEMRAEILAELADEGVIVSQEESDVDDFEESADSSSDGKDYDTWTGPKITINGDDDDDSDCDVETGDLDLPVWLARRLTKERLIIVCERIKADSGADFLSKLIDNIPAALFVLLPLMAFVLKIMYPLSKRYYVEHLLFVVHFHAYFFLMLILMILFSRLGELIQLPETPVTIAIVAMSLYVPVYLYKALRRVYSQRHLATIPKYVFLIMAYLAGLFAIFGSVALLAAFSI